MNKAGLLLIVAGLVILVWGAFGFRTRDTVANFGPIHVTKETEHNIPYAPIIGVIVLLGGVGIVVSARR